jgi:hypothetical protein
MTHHCSACSSEFDDDSGALPNADCVHCVFCGARIPLQRSGARRGPTSLVPFSKDYEREEAFALGVINHGGPGFPDTLRQFRIPGHPPADSLTPVEQGSEPPSALPPRAPRRVASLSMSLSVGFGVGVGMAFAAVSLRSSGNATPTASPVMVTLPATPQATEPAKAVPSAPAPALSPSAPPTPPRALVSATAKPPSAEQERRWLLERARTEQRLYRIGSAERLYRQILARSPRDSEALSGLGELDLLRGTVDLAGTHFQHALDANANYIPAQIAAADIRWQAGRVEEARQAYRDIVDRYSADRYPPYVTLRSTGATTPACER